MEILGPRLREQRKKKYLLQKDVAGQRSASLLSKVETGAAYPSWRNLWEWSRRIDCTVSYLIGDELLLALAKESILLTEKCLAYLAFLPEGKTTMFLKELSTSAGAWSRPIPKPPRDPELQYLTARVLIHRNQLKQAKTLIKEVLALSPPKLWQIYHLSLLCQVQNELSEPLRKKETEASLYAILHSLNYQEMLLSLPDGEACQWADLELLKISTLFSKFVALSTKP